MQRTFALAALFALMACFEAAARDYAYDHNGSRMKVSVNGAEVRIVYERPRSGLRGVGVRPGTLLFLLALRPGGPSTGRFKRLTKGPRGAANRFVPRSPSC